MLDHGEIRGDHLSTLDRMAVALKTFGLPESRTIGSLSVQLELLGYGPAVDCSEAAAKIVEFSKVPREEPKRAFT
jgi:hypothetical protein